MTDTSTSHLIPRRAIDSLPAVWVYGNRDGVTTNVHGEPTTVGYVEGADGGMYRVTHTLVGLRDVLAALTNEDLRYVVNGRLEP